MKLWEIGNWCGVKGRVRRRGHAEFRFIVLIASMTCGYMRDVATANTSTFFRLLFRWNGSVWKAIHMELIVWLFVFVNVRTVYEFFLYGTDAEHTYEHIVLRCREISEKCRTVMTFAIGFFVTYVSTRWWNIFMTIPWPDTCALQLTAYLRVRGAQFEQEDKLFRQNIMRYLWLSYVLVFRDVSVRIKKRFPTVKSLTPTLLTEEELNKLNKSSKEMRPWVPIEWALDYLRSARRRLLIDEFHHVEINQTILSYRQQLHEILSHDSITVPLVYVQAVHICTICYFLITCFASQTVHKDHVRHEGAIDLYLPAYAIIEFIVFVGWLKTAFVMLNPFGMDDDDFEMNAMIERNLMISLCYINDFYDKPPKLVDMKVCLPTNLQTAVRENANPMHGSAVPVKVTKVHQAMLGDRQIANLVSSVLPNRHASSVTGLQTNRPIDEIVNFRDTNLLLPPDEKSDRDRVIKNPDNSSKEEGVGPGRNYVLRQEDLEAAVAKLMDKRIAEERVTLLSLKSTQRCSEEDLTQRSMGESTKAPDLNKKRSKLKSHRSKQDVRNQTAASAKKPTANNSPMLVSPLESRESSLRCEETQKDV